MPDLIKKFFDTFEIEPYKTPSREYDSDGEICSYYIEYPEITDHILLELICILGNNSYFLITDDGLPIDVDGLKKSVLHSLTLQAKFDKNKVLKQQIQELFKGE